MRRRTVAANAFILTATGLVLRAAGMLFRVYIAARVGAQGMGLYQLILTVYGLAVILATAGVQMLATRSCSGLMAQGKQEAVRGAVRRLTVLALLLGVAAAALLGLPAPALARRFLTDANAALALRILAPSLPFMAAAAVLRGFFMAQKQVGPNAVAQLFEQAVRIALVAAVLGLALPRGDAAACAAVVLGNTVSEVLSWGCMRLFYARAARVLPRGTTPPLARQMAVLLAPVWGGQLLTGALRCAENLLIPAQLALYTGAQDTALAQFGALKGMAMPVLFFPFSFIGTLATLLLPDITAAHVRGQRETLRRLVCRVLLFTMLVAVMAGGLFTALGAQLGQVLYGSAEIGFYLRVLGPLAPLMYLEGMVDGILKGLDRQAATFRYSVVDSALRIALIPILVPRWGMRGFLFLMLVSNLLTSILNLRKLLETLQLRFRWGDWLAKPALCAACAGVAADALWRIACAYLPNAAALTVCGCAFCLGYALAALGVGAVKISDFRTAKG